MQVGWEFVKDESHVTGLLRSGVISVLGLHGDANVIQEAKNRFNQFANQNVTSALHPDVRQAVYSIVLHSTGGTER